MHPYHCPTKVYTNQQFSTELGNFVGVNRPLLLTSCGWLKRGIVDLVGKQVSSSLFVADGVASHPKVAAIVAIERALPDFDMVIAVGGGSVIDAAKGVIALRALRGDANCLLAALTQTSALPTVLNCAPLLAVPTTSGSGSEVTPWGTLWGDHMEKFSLSHPNLYPSVALLDASLCLSMPREVTLWSGLDALSHAMEAIWNRRSSPASDFAAAASIRTLKFVLPEVLETPNSIELRREIQTAALYAGYAMAYTQTALSHSISYPLTAGFGLPHGFACSLTLGEVARFNSITNPSRLSVIAEAFGCDVVSLPEKIHEWMMSVNITKYLRQYLTDNSAERFGDDLINPARAGNNIRLADGTAARNILRDSLRALL